ncbi:hypothetical protein FOMPIDRAFT_1025110 [Fomitopsis schrenkii]|uniref:Secreted protein n=1 Tax=Fomitopsis schrenkii TaxID=2126942 RepID=S8DVG6_FOMSC|nr:hypothetical protein FOMPIDRAFT_1025110 [Fomitopsis schrenkii]
MPLWSRSLPGLTAPLRVLIVFDGVLAFCDCSWDLGPEIPVPRTALDDVVFKVLFTAESEGRCSVCVMGFPELCSLPHRRGGLWL